MINPSDPLDIERIRAEISKLIAESGKLNAEQPKLNHETRYDPFLALGAFFGAAIAFGEVLFGG